MDYSFTNQAILSKLGLETLKVTALEERVCVLETALDMTLGGLKVGENGMDADLFAAASAEISRRTPPKDEPEPVAAGTPDPEEQA